MTLSSKPIASLPPRTRNRLYRSYYKKVCSVFRTQFPAGMGIISNTVPPYTSPLPQLTSRITSSARRESHAHRHGLPVGSDIEYTDEITMLKAMEGQREL